MGNPHVSNGYAVAATQYGLPGAPTPGMTKEATAMRDLNAAKARSIRHTYLGAIDLLMENASIVEPGQDRVKAARKAVALLDSTDARQHMADAERSEGGGGYKVPDVEPGSQAAENQNGKMALAMLALMDRAARDREANIVDVTPEAET